MAGLSRTNKCIFATDSADGRPICTLDGQMPWTQRAIHVVTELAKDKVEVRICTISDESNCMQYREPSENDPF